MPDTATPFANILINHEAIDRDVWEDLYPKHFIVNLPRLPGYVGAERLFGRDALPGDEPDGVEGVDVVRTVSEVDRASVVPGPGQTDVFEPQMCESLRNAFLDFVLAVAGRAQRTGADHPASMLIHTSHRTLIQNRMGEVARDHVSVLRQQWRYDRESIRPDLENRWETEFRPVIASTDVTRDVPFTAIEEHIDRLFRDPLRVIVLNSASPDVLDYEAEPNLKAVLIGGNRLSRGLTLEGLVVSYYVRNAGTFDTLLQMGRWFGYRESYVDLTRLWTTDDLAGRFSSVALAEEELRREAERYQQEHLTPVDFGLKIRAHPAMLVTAANKMGAARQISQNYAGHLLQTITFRLEDRVWLQRNLDAARTFLASLGRPGTIEDSRYVWDGVNAREIDDFLAAYSIDPRSSFMDASAVRQYINQQRQQDELIRWKVGVISQASARDVENLGIQGTRGVNTITRTRERSNPRSIGVLINPATAGGRAGAGDEEIGLTDGQIQRARANAGAGAFRTLGKALRAERDRGEGLLLLYPISRFSSPRENSEKRIPLFENPERDGCTVVGIALVFPASDSAATIEYMSWIGWRVAGSGMTGDDLDKVWAELPSPAPGELSGIRASGLPLQSPVYIVVDRARTRQLMVAMAEGAEALRSTTTRGLEVTTDELRIGDSPLRRYIRLVCLNASHHATFAALCSSIVAGVLRDPADPKAAVVRCLDRWRSFWVVDQSGLTREQALGLFGELWFLYRWSGPVSISSLARWQGPLGARHDFQWPVASIEVKASASVSGAGATHFIASLDQLG